MRKCSYHVSDKDVVQERRRQSVQHSKVVQRVLCLGYQTRYAIHYEIIVEVDLEIAILECFYNMTL